MVTRANINLGAIRSAGRKVGGARFLKNLDQQLYLSREKEKERAFDLAEKEKDRTIQRQTLDLNRKTKQLSSIRTMLMNISDVKDYDIKGLWSQASAAGMSKKEFDGYVDLGSDKTTKLRRDQFKDQVVPLFENRDPNSITVEKLLPNLEDPKSEMNKVWRAMGYPATYTSAKNQWQLIYGRKNHHVDNPQYKHSGAFINITDDTGKNHRIMLSHNTNYRKTLNKEATLIQIASRYRTYFQEIDKFFKGIKGLDATNRTTLHSQLSSLFAEIPLSQDGSTIEFPASMIERDMPNLQTALGNNADRFFLQLPHVNGEAEDLRFKRASSSPDLTSHEKRKTILPTSKAQSSALVHATGGGKRSATGLEFIVPDRNQQSQHPKFQLSLRANDLFEKMMQDEDPKSAKAFFEFIDKNFKDEIPNIQKALTHAVLARIPRYGKGKGTFNKKDLNPAIQIENDTVKLLKVPAYKKAHDQKIAHRDILRDLELIQKITTTVGGVTGPVAEAESAIVGVIKEIKQIGGAIATVADVITGTGDKTRKYLADQKKKHDALGEFTDPQGLYDREADRASWQLFKAAESFLDGDLKSAEENIQKLSKIQTRTKEEDIALQKYQLQKLLIFKKMALTYKLSGMLQGSEGGGRTISNQDFDVAMRALWGNQDGLVFKLENVINSSENTLANAQVILDTAHLGHNVVNQVSDVIQNYASYRSDKLANAQMGEINKHNLIGMEKQTGKYRIFARYRATDKTSKNILSGYEDNLYNQLKTDNFDLNKIALDRGGKSRTISIQKDFSPEAQQIYDQTVRQTLGAFYQAELLRTGYMKQNEIAAMRRASQKDLTHRTQADNQLIQNLQTKINEFFDDKDTDKAIRERTKFENTIKSLVLHSVINRFRQPSTSI